jgi:hypothetical protein
MPVALKSLSRKPKPPKPPEADPRFVKVMGDLRQKSLKVRQHPAPSKKASEAQAAAKGPANEKRAGAQEKQTDKIKDAKTKKPDENSFLALLRAEIQKAMPKTLADTETFMKGGDAPALTSSLKGNVSKQKQDATGDTAKTTKQAPDESSVQAKPVTPIPGEPQPPAPDIPAGDAMPQPKPDAEVSVQDSKQDTDAAMKDAEVTDDQCKKANDPRFSSVLTAKGDVAKQADAAPAKYRAGEKAALGASVAQSKAAAKVGAALMLQGKAKSKAGVSSKQEDAKKKDEQERQQVTDRIEAIFNKTKQQVEAKLTALDEEVNSIFDTGTEAALSAMKAYVEKRIDDYKDERYSGLVGKGRWLKDKFMGLPDEANVFYVQGRNLFTQLMDALVVRVANLVETRLREAKSLVAAGQAEIKSYVASLSPKLKGVGLEAQKKVSDQFAELERTIDDKKNQLAQSLAQKYKEAFDKADKALKEIQDANKGLVSAFLDKLGEIIKIIMEFKDKLMGVLRKGWDVIKGILADPIGFLGNLIAAIKQGVGQFVSNIWTHLKAGFMKWLFGALADAGIEIPPGLPSLPSILKLVLSVLGLTYERMRAKAVKLLGPTAVTIIEKVIEYVRALITGGPAALWEKVQQDLGMLKQMVIDAIQDWIVTTIIKQATVKLLSMFNPAGAFVQACIMIYNTVMFLIERAAQIMAFVEAVINSVSAIASGAIGGAAAWIERSLANAIPIVIGFLAALIGLGGISKKIRETIEKVQGIVDRAIDKAIGKVIEMVKKLFGKLFGAKDPKKQEENLGKAMEAARGAVARFSGKKVGLLVLRPVLAAIRVRYGLQSLEATKEGSRWAVRGTVNPSQKILTDALIEGEIEGDLTEQELFEILMLRITPPQEGGPGAAPETEISISSLSLSAAIFDEYIGAAPAPDARKKSAAAAVAAKVAEAGAAKNGDDIYKALQVAAGIVNGLYKVKGNLPAWYKPLALQIHHEQEVHEHPEMFPATRLARTTMPKPIQDQMDRSIKSIKTKYNAMKGKTKAERKALAEADINELAALVKQSLLDWKSTRERDETGKRTKTGAQAVALDERLAEVDMVAASRNAHIEIHRRRKGT